MVVCQVRVKNVDSELIDDLSNRSDGSTDRNGIFPLPDDGMCPIEGTEPLLELIAADVSEVRVDSCTTKRLDFGERRSGRSGPAV